MDRENERGRQEKNTKKNTKKLRQDWNKTTMNENSPFFASTAPVDSISVLSD
jgi:hypothetical protein